MMIAVIAVMVMVIAIMVVMVAVVIMMVAIVIMVIAIMIVMITVMIAMMITMVPVRIGRHRGGSTHKCERSRSTETGKMFHREVPSLCALGGSAVATHHNHVCQMNGS